jgi:hypothetical protein
MYALDDTIALQEVIIEDFSIVGCYAMSELWFLVHMIIVHLSVGSSRDIFLHGPLDPAGEGIVVLQNLRNQNLISCNFFFYLFIVISNFHDGEYRDYSLVACDAI